ncbi:uncharacterized protein LOC121781514 [Salvia splendens]|uniref:uncharacterized protein LOC121781514 n=1 Tax=Salvia splendens TaxID=180675 RepID=UPI001C26631C|nr:uncharacterized protein LOC121781514 [Salvia splendens]
MKGKGTKRETSSSNLDSQEPRMDIKSILKDIEFLGSSHMTWKQKRDLENKKVVSLGGKPPKKQRLPLSVARVSMMSRPPFRRAILGRFGAYSSSSSQKVPERKPAKDKILKSMQGDSRNGVLNVGHLDPLEEVTEDCLPLISAQQYASRNEMLMSLIIAWSPIVETSGNDVAFPSSSSNCCSILAVGGKCGKISSWSVRAPECYSTDNAGHASEVRLVGLVKAHDSWIAAISWVRYGSNDSKTQFALANGSSNGSLKIWLVNGEKLLKASEVINDSLSLLREVATVDSSMISVLSLTVPARSPTKLFLAIGKSSGSFELCTLDTSTGKFDNIGCYNAHDSTVSGLAWAFDGRCLYSCSQNNSLKS